MTSSRRSLALDSNVWRYLVDHDGVERMMKAARASNTDIVMLPAVLYETLRMPDGDTRRLLIKAQTRQAWRRLMPEAYTEAEELRLAIERLRPAWIKPHPDLSAWRSIHADWLHGTWYRARHQTELMSEYLREEAPHNANELEIAREESREMRRVAQRVGVSFGTLKIGRLESWFEHPVPGWDGEKFDTWRSEGMNAWLPVLAGHQRGAYAEWLLPWLNEGIVESDISSWVSFWTRDSSPEDLPRHWLRTAMKWAASTRKTSSGTPVDIQISTYLYECDHFLTSDSVFVDCIEKIRPLAPARIATTHLLPGRERGVERLLQLIETR